jgi:DNA-binding PadR family transcriptional regulator
MDRSAPLSATDFHVLLVLSESDLYGYAIMKAIEANSGGAVAPEIGSLYRVIARLIASGWVSEAEGPQGEAVHRGRPRKYYGITPLGRDAARVEAARLSALVELAKGKELLPGSMGS